MRGLWRPSLTDRNLNTGTIEHLKSLRGGTVLVPDSGCAPQKTCRRCQSVRSLLFESGGLVHCGNGSEGRVDISVCVLHEGDVIGCDVQSTARITSQLRVELKAQGSVTHALSCRLAAALWTPCTSHTFSDLFSLSRLHVLGSR